jgi:uracil-DNA glycosylase
MRLAKYCFELYDGECMSEIRIDPSWKKALEPQFGQPYWESLTEFVRDEYKNKTVYPPGPNIFRAFDLCPFDKVKVVIVGQDPYHGVRQANGLSFSVNDGIPLPPSLKNIYQEIRNDLGVTPSMSGDLTRWAKQGVLMLNSVLTVLAGNPASHAGKGWETFTDAVIQSLNDEREHIVYMLWGKYAQMKGTVINREKNLVLTSAHPSPYSVTNFYGNHHFSRCNKYLEEHGMIPIDWS